MTDIAAPSLARLVSRTRAVPDDRDPVAILGADGFAWLREGAGLVTAGVAARIPVPPGAGHLSAAAERAAELLGGLDTDDPLGLPGTGPLAVGALPFSEDSPGELIVPALVYGRTGDGRAWVTETGSAGQPTEPRLLPPASDGPAGADGIGGGRARGAQPALVVVGADGRPQWTRAVGRALELIAAGTVDKIVLARRLEIRAGGPFDARAIVDRLRRQHVSCWTYAMGNFVGASPELLVRRRGGRVESRPMAGTVAQGIAAAEDDRLVGLLESSAKERAEHALVVDEVLAGLAPVCREVSAQDGPEVVRLATVAHLATTVIGRLQEPPATALALAARLHPTPAVAGAPRQAALTAIAEMEDFDRGLYAGPVGWVDRRGDGDWAVALRGAQLRGDRAVLTAGAGIVSDSDADAEWRETRAKLEPMLKALAGL